MLRVERTQGETAMGVRGAALTATARAISLRLSSPIAAGSLTRVVPVRVEVLDASGRRHVALVHDYGRAIRIAILTTGTLLVYGHRELRRKRGRRQPAGS